MGDTFSTPSENRRSQTYQAKKASSQSSSTIKAFHTKEEWISHFNASKDTNKLLVIDFTATWCGPCRSMEPILKELCERFSDVDFIKIDVDELPDVAAEFGVQAMPTFLLIKRGNQVDSIVGARKEELQIKVEKHRKTSNYIYNY